MIAEPEHPISNYLQPSKHLGGVSAKAQGCGDILSRQVFQVYFAHPYSSWERPKNERHNGLLRRYLPKGKPMDQYQASEIKAFAVLLNDRPRRHLGYKTPSELFEQFLDEVYAA
jgi:IS30 family transposase